MNTQIKNIKGITVDGQGMRVAEITARFTSDRIGETLSLENGDCMIEVAFEELKQMIEKARKLSK